MSLTYPRLRLPPTTSMLDSVTVLLVCLTLTSLAHASAVSHVQPLVVWHGLGDSYASPGMVQFENEVKKMHPGIFVHSIYIEQDDKADQRAGFVSGRIRYGELVYKGTPSMEMLTSNSPLSLSS